MTKGVIVLCAGGTGGHLFPAEALTHELNERGWSIHLATDKRARHYAKDFPAIQIHMIEAASPSGVNPFKMLKAGLTLLVGMRTSKKLFDDLKPKAVIGFGGYPTVPPLMAALRKFPTLIHEQNAVAGRANKMLAKRVTAIAGGFLKAEGEYADRIIETGNPVRPAVKIASAKPYAAIDDSGPIRLVIFGGSQGARFFSKTIPEALGKLPEVLRKRIHLTQQARPEDQDEVRAACEAINVQADVSPFFANLPERIGNAHLVMARSGASTVSEIAAIGRPAILVPYPYALDHDQAANAAALEAAGGAKVMRQSELDADVIAAEFQRLFNAPEELAKMAAAAKAAGRPDADILLADLAEAIASGKSAAEFKAARL